MTFDPDRSQRDVYPSPGEALPPHVSTSRSRLWRVIRVIIVALLLAVAAPYLLTPIYAVGHPVSTLMIGRWLTGGNVSRVWVDLDEMSPALPRTAVAAEDAKFCAHHGIDWDSVRDIIDDVQDGEIARGGSTITQQVAKNLFLWPGRSVVRKALEFPLAFWIDLVLSKKRILEIYLNVAELGPDGQFGAEAAALYAFGRPAASLTPQQAALLVATLPNPVTRSAKNPGTGLRRTASMYVGRAQSAEISSCWGQNR